MAVALSVLILLAAAPAWSQGRGSCAQATIPWSSILPDGSTQDAGSMSLCLNRMYNPAAGLHEIQIDGSPIGIFMSRVRQSEIKRVHRAPVVDVRVGVTVHVEKERPPVVGGESRSKSHVTESPVVVVCSHVVRDRDHEHMVCACGTVTVVAGTRLR